MNKVKTKNILLCFIICGIIFGSFSVFATTNLIDSDKVNYKDNKSVKEAMQTLHTGSDSKVPSGPSFMLVGSNLIGVAYLDPTDLTKRCNDRNSVSATGTASGCMKWYVYAEDTTTYTMILDHNTYTNVTFGDTIIELNNLKSAWNSTIGSSNVRMITGTEIKTITGNTTWVKTTANTWYYLDSNSSTQVANESNKSKYTWLFDYTSGCTTYGCNNVDSVNALNYGYWTSTCLDETEPASSCSSSAWRIYYDGRLVSSLVTKTNNGLRPVITVPKTIFN